LIRKDIEPNTHICVVMNCKRVNTQTDISIKYKSHAAAALEHLGTNKDILDD